MVGELIFLATADTPPQGAAPAPAPAPPAVPAAPATPQ